MNGMRLRVLHHYLHGTFHDDFLRSYDTNALCRRSWQPRSGYALGLSTTVVVFHDRKIKIPKQNFKKMFSILLVVYINADFVLPKKFIVYLGIKLIERQ